MHVLGQPQGPVHLRHAADEHHRARHRVATWWAAAAGAAWGGTLAGVLLGMGRVPWIEALLWSAVSAAVVARSMQVALRRLLRWLLAPCVLELGTSDPARLRAALPRALARRGYRLDRRNLQRDGYCPMGATSLLPAFAVVWSGPGAIVSGPRWLVRLAARIAVG